MDTKRKAKDRRALRCARWLTAAVVALGGIFCADWCPGETTDLRLRVSIDCASEAAWSGRLILSGGQLSQLQRLEMVIDDRTPQIINRETIAFQRPSRAGPVVFDVTATTDLNSAISLELQASDRPGPATMRIPMIDVVNGALEQTPAATPFTVQVARVPGDSLRVRLARQHLIFHPGETCLMDVVPHLAAIDTGASARLDVRMYAARSRRTLWRHQQTLKPKEGGYLPAVDRLEVPLPDREGVYDIVLSLSRDGLRNPLKSNSPAAERSVQVVVVSPVPTPGEAADQYREVLEYDTSQPQWWERLARFPAWEGLPRSWQQLLGENFGQPLFRQGRNLNRIEGDGWLALPLPVMHQGRVHRLEIEYPTDIEQTMAVTIVERDPDSDSFTPVVQTGFHVSPQQAERAEGTQSIMFWPRNRFGYIVLSNKSSTQPIEFGRVRVLEGPEETTSRPAAAVGTRRSLLHLTDANLPRVLGGSLATDPLLRAAADRLADVLGNWSASGGLFA